MRVLSLLTLGALWTTTTSQNISYDSVLCNAVGIPYSSVAVKDQYKIMIANLSTERTLKAQKSRVTDFILDNWKELKAIDGKAEVIDFLQDSHELLENRWRIVAYLKGLLAKMKPKFRAAKLEAKFDEIKKQLWSQDLAEKQDVSKYYDKWILAAIKASPVVKKNNVIADVIISWESRNASNIFDDVFYSWRPKSDSPACF